MNDRRETVVVAMSGGIDSTTTALLLTRQGHKAIGVHLRLCAHHGDPQAAAAQERNAEDARAAAESLGMEFHILDAQREFQRDVVEPFVAEYLAGATPNPCSLCNPRIKMGVLLDWALARGADCVATGHYARVGLNAPSGRWELRRGVDGFKDQTYFLSRLTQDKLERFRTPLGAMTKDQVRVLANDNHLRVAQKQESQEICFIADDDYRRFLLEYLEAHPAAAPEALAGPIVDRQGNELGRHAGIHTFTIGQRRGIGVSAPRPLYVLELRAADRAVVVGPDEALLASALETDAVVWGAQDGLSGEQRAHVQVRYRSAAAKARIRPLEGGKRVRVDFDEPQRAITPGQTATLYDEANETVLGGARIARAISSCEA